MPPVAIACNQVLACIYNYYVLKFNDGIIIANCGNPFYQNQLNNSNLQVAGNTNPALEGDSVIFSCSLGLEINGSNVSTCMGNGKWEPAPEEVECKGKCIYLSFTA